MIIAHHLILTGYGHWLPNDPRGSMSRDFRSGKVMKLGPMHYDRKALQPSRLELRDFYKAAKDVLQHLTLWFDGAKRQVIAEAFSEVVLGRRYTCFAWAILSNHTHMIVRKHRDHADTMLAEFARESAKRLRHFADVPDDHPVWNNRPYKVYLDTPDRIRRVVRYVQDNPIKEGLPAQEYSFVKAYKGEWDTRRQ